MLQFLVGCLLLTELCANGDASVGSSDGSALKDGIKSVEVDLSALEYGPPAIHKIMAMGGSTSSDTWSPGKKVKVVV